MNRRSFLRRTFGAIATAASAPFWPKAEPITFKGIPLVYDQNVSFKIMGIYNLHVDNPRRLAILTSIC